MFGNYERDLRIARLEDANRLLCARMTNRVYDMGQHSHDIHRLFAETGENEKAIALILQHLGLEYRVIPKHPELVPRETADAE